MILLLINIPLLLEINLKDLKYKKFFKSANSMGAKEILCEYLNISNELTIPFQFHMA